MKKLGDIKNWIKGVGLKPNLQLKTKKIIIKSIIISIVIIFSCIIYTYIELSPKSISNEYADIQIYNKSYNIDIKESGHLKYPRLKPAVTLFSYYSNYIYDYWFLVSGGNEKAGNAEVIKNDGSLCEITDPVFNDKTSIFVNSGLGNVAAINNTGKYDYDTAVFRVFKKSINRYKLNFAKRTQSKLLLNYGIYIYGGYDIKDNSSSDIIESVSGLALEYDIKVDTFNSDFPVNQGTLISKSTSQILKNDPNVFALLAGGKNKQNMTESDKIYVVGTNFKVMNKSGELHFAAENLQMSEPYEKFDYNKAPPRYIFAYSNENKIIYVIDTKNLSAEIIKTPEYLKDYEIHSMLPYFIFEKKNILYICKINKNQIKPIAKIALKTEDMTLVKTFTGHEETKLAFLLIGGKEKEKIADKIYIVKIKEGVIYGFRQ